MSTTYFLKVFKVFLFFFCFFFCMLPSPSKNFHQISTYRFRNFRTNFRRFSGTKMSDLSRFNNCINTNKESKILTQHNYFDNALHILLKQNMDITARKTAYFWSLLYLYQIWSRNNLTSKHQCTINELVLMKFWHGRKVFLLLRIQVMVNLTAYLFFQSNWNLNYSSNQLIIQSLKDFFKQGCLALVLQQSVLYNTESKNIKTIITMKVN